MLFMVCIHSTGICIGVPKVITTYHETMIRCQRIFDCITMRKKPPTYSYWPKALNGDFLVLNMHGYHILIILFLRHTSIIFYLVRFEKKSLNITPRALDVICSALGLIFRTLNLPSCALSLTSFALKFSAQDIMSKAWVVMDYTLILLHDLNVGYWWGFDTRNDRKTHILKCSRLNTMHGAYNNGSLVIITVMNLLQAHCVYIVWLKLAW